MRNLWLTRNIILPRVALAVLFTVFSSKVTGFSFFGRWTTTNCVTKPNWCSLSACLLWALAILFPSLLSQLLSPVRQIGWYGTFIHIGLLYLRTLRGAPKDTKGNAKGHKGNATLRDPTTARGLDRPLTVARRSLIGKKSQGFVMNFTYLNKLIRSDLWGGSGGY